MCARLAKAAKPRSWCWRAERRRCDVRVVLKHPGKLSVYNVYVRRVEDGWSLNFCI